MRGKKKALHYSHLNKPFDLAYDKFIDWFDSNNEYVYQKRIIDWQTVYGDEFVEKQTNLFKYFAKCLGCRILDYGNEVATNLKRDTFRHFGSMAIPQ